MLDYNLSEDSDNAASPEEINLGSTKKSRKHATSPLKAVRKGEEPIKMKRGFFNVVDEDQITFKSSTDDCKSSVDLQRSIEDAWRVARDQQKSEARLRLSRHAQDEEQDFVFHN